MPRSRARGARRGRQHALLCTGQQNLRCPTLARQIQVAGISLGWHSLPHWCGLLLPIWSTLASSTVCGCPHNPQCGQRCELAHLNMHHQSCFCKHSRWDRKSAERFTQSFAEGPCPLLQAKHSDQVHNSLTFGQNSVNLDATRKTSHLGWSAKSNAWPKWADRMTVNRMTHSPRHYCRPRVACVLHRLHPASP